MDTTKIKSPWTCDMCPTYGAHRKLCVRQGEPCPPVELMADGNKPLREYLTDTSILEQIDHVSYCDALVELSSSVERIREDQAQRIRSMPMRTYQEAQLRAIAAMLAYSISRRTICRLLHIGHNTLDKIIERMTKRT